MRNLTLVEILARNIDSFCDIYSAPRSFATVDPTDSRVGRLWIRAYVLYSRADPIDLRSRLDSRYPPLINWGPRAGARFHTSVLLERGSDGFARRLRVDPRSWRV